MEEREAKGFGYIAGKWPLDPAQSTIIFIHGAGGSGHFWQSQVEALAKQVNTVALDLPGHGRSKGNGKDKVKDYVRSVADFIEAIEAPGLIPCGLSMGGAITLQLLLDYPERFRAGILVGTGAKLRVLPAIFETIENDYPGFIEMLNKFAASEKADPKLIQFFREDMARCKPEVAHGDFRACNGFDVMEKLAKIKVPVLVVTAEEDMLTPPRYGEFLEKAIKNASRTHIMDAGHIVPMEKPDVVNKAIIEFLDQAGL